MEIKELMIDGEKAYELKNDELDVIVSSFGAGIYSLKYHERNMVITPKDYMVYCYSDGYYGKTVGRIAGRIENGVLKFRDKEYELPTNENGNTLHSGGEGFSFQKFLGRIKDNELILSLDSEDGDSNFPGNLHLDVIYSLNGNSLTIRYESTSDLDTPVNFTNHSYFNLGEDDAENLVLRLASNEVERYSKELIPLGLETVRDCLDFREGKKIGDDIADSYLHLTRTNGYDHCFYLNEKKEGEAPISLKGNSVCLDIFTTLPAVQVYSSNFFPDNLIANNDKPFYAHNSVAIEPVYLPMDFEEMVSKAYEKKINTIRYEFHKIGE